VCYTLTVLQGQEFHLCICCFFFVNSAVSQYVAAFAAICWFLIINKLADEWKWADEKEYMEKNLNLFAGEIYLYT
jgi:hypothetical protein